MHLSTGRYGTSAGARRIQGLLQFSLLMQATLHLMLIFAPSKTMDLGEFVARILIYAVSG